MANLDKSSKRDRLAQPLTETFRFRRLTSYYLVSMGLKWGDCD